MELKNIPYFFEHGKNRWFWRWTKSTDSTEILHWFFSVLPKGNVKVVRLIVLNPVSRTTLTGVHLFLHVEILKFWILDFVKSRRCEIGVNALTQSPLPCSCGHEQGRGCDFVAISSVDAFNCVKRRPGPCRAISWRSHRSMRLIV